MEVRPAIAAISLPELVALNDEMAALVRSGASLERGLIDLGSEAPGRLGDLATHLGERLRAGESFPSILSDRTSRFPPVWRATVLAGLRSGRLAQVLESLAVTGRRVAEMRKSVGAALAYPIIVVILAYLVFVFLVTYLAPLLSNTFLDLTQSSEPVVSWFAWLGLNVAWWVFWPPVALAALLFAEWWQTGQAFRSADGPLTRVISQVWPKINRSRREARLASFLEILALLIREQTPLPEALVLAASASGDPRLQASAQTLAERIRGGQAVTAEEIRALQIPPLLGFMLSTQGNPSQLSDSLELTAVRYRERSLTALTRTITILPIVLTALIGGMVTLAVCLAMIWPVWQLILRLGG